MIHTIALRTTSRRRALQTVLATAATVVVIALTGACGHAPAGPSVAPTGPDELSPVVQLVVQRLATADDVAGSKWHSGGSITDPAREQAVIDASRAGATSRGLDPDAAATIFRDQIEANKVVQYGLFSDWSADPAQAPAAAPDLTRIRPQLDRITTGLLDVLAATRGERADPGCPAVLGRAVGDSTAQAPVDPVHRRGLDRALASVCR